MSVYKLSSTIVGQSNEASLDIRVEGLLYAVSITARTSGMDALGDYAEIEVSFGSVLTILTNDVLQSIFLHAVTNNFLTSGGGVGSCTAVSPALKIPVFAGERVYLHSAITSGVAGRAQAYLYIDDGTELKAARRRR